MFAPPVQRSASSLSDDLAVLVAELQPAEVPLGAATGLWQSFNQIEKFAAAAKRLLAARVDAAGLWRQAGCGSAAEFLARESGTSLGSARNALDTSKLLGNLDDVADALRAGELSGDQADVIADAAAANPAAEEKLVEDAKKSPMKDLKEECGRAKHQANPDPEATRKRIHKKRHLRFRTAADGSFTLHGAGTVEDGAKLTAALQPFVDEAFTRHRKAGNHEQRDAYLWDALVNLTRGGGSVPDRTSSAERNDPPAGSSTGSPTNEAGSSTGSPADKPDLDAGLDADDDTEWVRQSPRRRRDKRPRALIRVDLAALTRGRLDPNGLDETCEIAGVGPISVESARELLSDALLHLVITDGVDVRNITHLGRGPNGLQKLALLWSGDHCSNERCHRQRLEMDHRLPYARDRKTELANLDPLCGVDHDLKTHEGWALVNGTGRRAFVPPDDPRHPNNTDPTNTARSDIARSDIARSDPEQAALFGYPR